ncbi:hypothetical protein P5G65_01425 [Paenibacillus chondroitinus]|uniref:Uncharacterized protein n=1 Tax=Paenibacillus chondroitinus TaxID=59842 RepID=A0ABU6D6G6_9BACL|nr:MULTISPECIES: hypothetical protein [Paenibacillus]MCY9661292.1 hypothetical protein [Paenibacillus anseongense]MEB4792546.1 hypothetical protein [Paenibacillus chondroitinus]
MLTNEVVESEEAVEIETDVIFEQITNLIKELGVTHIFSYDDEWDMVSKEGEINVALEMGVEKFFEEFAFDIEESILTFLFDEGVNSVQEFLDFESPRIKIIKSDVIKFLNKQRNKKVLKTLDTFLQQLNEHGIIVEKFSNAIFTTTIEDVQGRILFLLDMNMEESDTPKQDVVVESLLKINESRKNKLDLALVYSHENLSVYNDHSTKRTYLETAFKENEALPEIPTEQLYLLAYQLWAVQKTPQIEELTGTFVQALEKAAFGHSLHDYLQLKISNINDAMFELIKFPEDKFDLLYRDSFVEGQLFHHTLDKTHKSLLNKVEYEKLRGDIDYRRVVSNVLRVARASNPRLLEDMSKEREIKDYRKKLIQKKISEKLYQNVSEFGLVDYSVNYTHQDIMTGDIFSLNLFEQGGGEEVRKYGILITAICDLPLRFSEKISDGISRNENWVTLYLFDAKPVNLVVEKLKGDFAGKYIWPIMDTGQADTYYALIPTKSAINIDASLLDLCTLNQNGHASIATIPEGSPVFDFKTYHFKEYYETHLKSWSQSIINIENYFSLGANPALRGTEDTILQYIPVLAGLKYSVKLDVEGQKFCAQRIGRLENSRVQKIIQGNASSISRIGTDINPLA